MYNAKPCTVVHIEHLLTLKIPNLTYYPDKLPCIVVADHPIGWYEAVRLHESGNVSACMPLCLFDANLR